jgi:hypothetical protein
MKGRRPDDPTPEEIAERAAEIRAEWCDEVRAQRETVRQRKDWRPPVHTMPQVMKSLGFN